MNSGSRIIDVQASILKDNEEQADALGRTLSERGVFLVNLMGSPGSGKTSLLAALLPLLSPPLRTAVIEADLDSRIDADALEARGWKAVQLRTGGFCHLDAFMVRRGLSELGVLPPEAGTPSSFDIVFVENVGNLICTAQVGTGAHLDIALLSVPEGDDKPLKYPVMFAKAAVVVVSKSDYLDRESFDVEAVRRRVRELRPDSRLFVVSVRTGQGLPDLARYVLDKVQTRKPGGSPL